MPMTIHSITSREFTAKVAEAKRWAAEGPVFITDRGAPAHVLLSIEEYRRLKGSALNLADALAMADGGDIAFDPPKADIQLRIPDDPGDEG